MLTSKARKVVRAACVRSALIVAALAGSSASIPGYAYEMADESPGADEVHENASADAGMLADDSARTKEIGACYAAAQPGFGRPAEAPANADAVAGEVAGADQPASGACLAGNPVDAAREPSAAVDEVVPPDRPVSPGGQPEAPPAAVATREEQKPTPPVQAAAEGAGESASVKPSAKERTKKRPRPPVGTQITEAWWPAPEPGKLNLVFAGEASFGQAIAILFDRPVGSVEAANSAIRVSDDSGVVDGRWLAAKGNDRMLIFKCEPGLYTIRIDSGLEATDGTSVGKALEGAVYVR